MRQRRFSRALLLFFCASPFLAAGEDKPAAGVAGIVADPAGAAVEGASVWLLLPGSRTLRVTDAQGRFAFEFPVSGEATLRVEARGFRRVESRVTAQETSRRAIEVVLLPASISDEITVTAARAASRLSETAASVVVLTSEQLAASAALTLDDAVRQVPGFTLFRRSGSRTANPTSQGVSLRGVGASGASRAAVFDDGILLNDPFGGWISWGRVPRAALERIEVLRGGASDLYGSAALGGVIQLVRRDSDLPFSLFLESSFGSQKTPEGSLYAAGRLGPWGATLAAEAFRTEGYVLVDDRERGSVDTPAGSRHSTADLTLERRSERGRLFLRGSLFDESRGNGTPLQENDTRIGQIAFGSEWTSGLGTVALRAYRTDQEFHQSFSAVAADRQNERQTGLQEVPAEAAGASVQWSRAIGSSHVLVGGLEARQVSGKSEEEIFAGGNASFVNAGGREASASLFLEDIFQAASRLTVTGAVRFDGWRNDRGRRESQARSQETSEIRFRPRRETAWSPRLSVLYRAGGGVSLAASAYRAFRAPTLNELYRSFRVGNVVTFANEDLEAERLSGGEAGASFAPASGNFFARGTLFWMEIDGAIANVTRSQTPTLITRQRDNLGRTRSRGLEIEADGRLGRLWRISGGYLFADSTVERSRVARSLEGRRIPQVPRHQATFQVRFAKPSLGLLSLQARFIGEQFDDDQNRLPLGSFWTLDGLLSRPVTAALEVFLAAENVFGERYEVGRTPVKTLGPPRLLRAGVRLRLAAKSARR